MEDTEITVAATGGGPSASLSPGHTVRVGDEQMYVTGAADVQGTITLTVQRGINGTLPVTHGIGSGVSVYRYASAVTEACLQQAAVWWRERLGAPFSPPEGDGRGGVDGISPSVRALLKPYRRRVAALGV